MRTLIEVLGGRRMTPEEYRIIKHFWTQIRTIQERRDSSVTKNRYLIGAAMAHRRIHQREIDLETLVSLTGLGRSSLQKTLKSMVVDDLIRLEKDPADRRRTLVRPTPLYTNLSLDMYEETRDLINQTSRQLMGGAKENDHK